MYAKRMKQSNRKAGSVHPKAPRQTPKAKPRGTSPNGSRKTKPHVTALELFQELVEKQSELDTPVALLNALVEHTVQILSAERGIISVYDVRQKNFRVVSTNDTALPGGFCFDSPQELAEHGIARYALVKQHEQTVGVLGVGGARRVKWSKTKQNWLQILAMYAAGILDPVQLGNPNEQRAQELPDASAMNLFLLELNHISSDKLSPHIVTRRLLNNLRAIIPFDNGGVWKRQKPTHFQLIGWYHGTPTAPSGGLVKLTEQNLPLTHEIVMHRNLIRINNVAQEPRWRAHLPNHTSGSWLGLPLVSGNKLIGVLSLGSALPNRFTQEHERILEILAGPIALLFHNVLLAESQGNSAERLALTDQVITAQEEERKRVALELHDEAGQSLVVLSSDLESLQNDLKGQSQTLAERARELAAMTRQTLESIRTVATQLRHPTLDLLGLDGALEQLCRDLTRRSGVLVNYHAEPIGKFSDRINLTFYRFVQEALTNVVKHANATLVNVNVEQDNMELRVTVHDDGKGFEMSDHLRGPRRIGHLGLLGMRERLSLVNGRLEIESHPGSGTVLTARVPLPGEIESPEV